MIRKNPLKIRIVSSEVCLLVLILSQFFKIVSDPKKNYSFLIFIDFLENLNTLRKLPALVFYFRPFLSTLQIA